MKRSILKTYRRIKEKTKFKIFSHLKNGIVRVPGNARTIEEAYNIVRRGGYIIIMK